MDTTNEMASPNQTPDIGTQDAIDWVHDVLQDLRHSLCGRKIYANEMHAILVEADRPEWLDLVSVAVTRAQRREYVAQWHAVLAGELAELGKYLTVHPQ